MKFDFVKQFYLLTQLWDSKQSKGFDLSSYVRKNVGYFLFVALLTAIYIGNVHVVQRKVRDVQQLSKDLQKTKWEYFTIQANSLEEGKISNVKEKVGDLGLKVVSTKPEKLIVSNE